ncbi:hypothetical protein BDQ12DRAFT_739529 [Crucibulum laeve]|uniref:Uncharacterized protein n=1 Tax=Crucibulum laeve TaxID=68775 RepID=A0A5C3LJ14_9AGAR|nr:hypothetical protein BDQ12DRAFT_739529 [Crucibulum laeve]
MSFGEYNHLRSLPKQVEALFGSITGHSLQDVQAVQKRPSSATTFAIMFGLKSIVVIFAALIAQSAAAPSLEIRTVCPGSNEVCDNPEYRCCGLVPTMQYCLPASAQC